MLNIIIVEDDPMIAEIYHKKFSDFGFNVFLADSGEKALTFAGKEKVDVVLTDLIMPKMNGFEVVKALREGNYDKNIKIIVFSNLSQKEDYEKVMKLGANGFIVKADFTPSALVDEVKRLIGQGNESEKNEMSRAEHKNYHLKKANINRNGNVENGSGKKILIIEDEEIFIEMFGDKLRQDGYRVESATNGAWGMKEATEKEFDLFIIDMIMPNMTGDEIVEKLKMNEKTKNIPIIVLSASVEPQIEKKVRKMGVNEFFVKTQIIPSQLSGKVAELIGK